MAKKKYILVEPDGWKAKVEGFGYEGRECDDAMRLFEEALGISSERRNKSEYRKKAVLRRDQRT